MLKKKHSGSHPEKYTMWSTCQKDRNYRKYK